MFVCALFAYVFVLYIVVHILAVYWPLRTVIVLDTAAKLQKVMSSYPVRYYNNYAMSCPIIYHYSDVIIGAMVSQITSLTFVYSTVIQMQIKGNN